MLEIQTKSPILLREINLVDILFNTILYNELNCIDFFMLSFVSVISPRYLFSQVLRFDEYIKYDDTNNL